uniref:kappa-type opioid receptor-like n=1 Tax=Styela clava TaxID=7725 RepID=UPI00193AB6CA|nr:kappa-type opioid receptor-like [Styela clava]XP_039272996.1 kappa-type opioid receptor-like [Styela clava]
MEEEEAKDDSNNTTLTVFRILFCIIGLFGNFIVIFVIIFLKEFKKSVTHWYVLQLAFADSIFLMNIPFKVIEDNHQKWIFSAGLCKIKESVVFLNYYSSILFLLVMSFDRYVAVCHGFTDFGRKLRSNKAAYIITAGVWLSALLLCIPVMLYSDKRGTSPNCKCLYEFPKSIEEKCMASGESIEECVNKTAFISTGPSCIDLEDFNLTGYDDYYEYSGSYEYYDNDTSDVTNMGCTYALSGRSWTVYLVLNFVIMFVIPVLGMSGCYFLISRELRKLRIRRSSVVSETISRSASSAHGKRSRSKSAASIKAEKNRIRVTYTCLALVLLFIVCWLPYHVVHMAKIKGIVNESTEFCARLGSTTSLLAYMNSAVNPYIYNLIGTRFFKRLRSAAESVRRSVKNRTSSITSGGGRVRHTAKKRSIGTHSVSSSMTATTKFSMKKYEGESRKSSSNAEDVREKNPEVQNPLVETPI